MNAFKELRRGTASLPVRGSVHHHFKLPAGWALDNEHSIAIPPNRKKLLPACIFSPPLKKSLIRVMGTHA